MSRPFDKTVRLCKSPSLTSQRPEAAVLAHKPPHHTTVPVRILPALRSSASVKRLESLFRAGPMSMSGWLLIVAVVTLSSLNVSAQPAGSRADSTDSTTMPAKGATTPAAQSDNRGWEGLARVLDALTPSTNTDEAPSGTQITDEIERLISQGRATEAIEMIDSREAELAAATAPGTDVQLMFQKARALTALDRAEEAQSIYQQMTVRFPELAEPWNNLAMLYVRSGSLDEAEFALETAVMNNPANGNAIANLADVRLLMALRDYREAARMKVPGAARRLKALESFLKDN